MRSLAGRILTFGIAHALTTKPPDLTALDCTTQATILQGFPVLAQHHLHLPTLWLWTERWERSLFRLEPQDCEAFQKHRVNRSVKCRIQHHRIEESIWIEPIFTVHQEGIVFWEYIVKASAVNSLLKSCHL